MTDLSLEDPLRFITKIRFWPSRGGRPFAKPALLDRQLRINRNTRAGSASGAYNQASIRMQGVQTSDPNYFIQQLMDCIGTKIRTRLRRVEGNGALAPHEWREVRDVEGSGVGTFSFKRNRTRNYRASTLQSMATALKPAARAIRPRWKATTWSLLTQGYNL